MIVADLGTCNFGRINTTRHASSQQRYELANENTRAEVTHNLNPGEYLLVYHYLQHGNHKACVAKRSILRIS